MDTYKRFFGNKNQSGFGISIVSENVDEEADNDCFTLSQKQDTDSGNIEFVEFTEVISLICSC